MKNDRLHKLAATGCLAALSSVLMLLDFPVGLIPGFIKFDFSDVPALIASFTIGPVWACSVSLIKNLINVIVSQSAGIGELANFIVSTAFVLPAGIVYRSFKASNRENAVLSACIVATVSMTLVSIPMNYFVLFPFYSAAYGTAMDSIVAAFMSIYPFADSLFKVILFIMGPFNVAKAVINCCLAALIYKRVMPAISHVF